MWESIPYFHYVGSDDETQVTGLGAVLLAFELSHGLSILSFVLQVDLNKKYTQNEMQSSPPCADSGSVFQLKQGREMAVLLIIIDMVTTPLQML